MPDHDVVDYKFMRHRMRVLICFVSPGVHVTTFQRLPRSATHSPAVDNPYSLPG